MFVSGVKVVFTATNLLYPAFLLIVFSLTVILIPREVYKKYMIYGMLVGGLGDVLSVFVYQNLLGFMWFKNQGLFYVLGQHALSPLCWTFTVMIFLYFLPAKRFFLYVYTLAWAMASVCYGYVVQNAKLFDFKSWFYPIPAFIAFLIWWSFAVWLYSRTE